MKPLNEWPVFLDWSPDWEAVHKAVVKPLGFWWNDWFWKW